MTWIQTFTGKAFDLLKPDASMVCVEDIAHHLALINRFTGATAVPYSVAQHSVLVSRVVPPELALPALLHDAAEAYATDVSRPLKEAMRSLNYGRPTAYDAISREIERVIGERFGVEIVHLDPRIKDADMRMLATERVHLHHSAPKSWDWKAEAYAMCPSDIAPWPWYESERLFLVRFAQVFAGAT
jgi:uncharacterized protein